MPWVVKARWRTAALSTAISVAGCSTTATIHRVNGPAYEAEIIDSTPTSLDVRGDDGRSYRVPREQVSDIDHPGNVLATVGAVLLGIGAVSAAAIATDSPGSDRKQAAITVGTVYGLPGLLMLVFGGAVWFTSKGKAKALEDAPAPLASMPPDRPTYTPPWATPAWPPAAPATSGPKPPIRQEAEPMPPRDAPPVAPAVEPPPAPEPAP